MTETGFTRTEFTPHAGQVTSIKFGNDASKRMLGTCGDDRKLRVWDISRPGQSAVHTFDLNSSGSGLNFNSEDSVVTTGLQNGSVKIWDLESCNNTRTLAGHRAEVSAVEHYEFHQSTFLASASLASDIKLWDVRKRGVVQTYGDNATPISCLRFSPDGKFMVSGAQDGVIKIWDLRSGKNVETKENVDGEIHDIQFHPSEMLFAAASQDGHVYFFDFENYQLVSKTTKSANVPTAIRFAFGGDTLTALMGDVLAEFQWEPCAKRVNAYQLNNGKRGDLMLSQNKAITSGIKERRQVVVTVVEPGKIEKRKPRAQSTPKEKINKSLPSAINISQISSSRRPVRVPGTNSNQNNSKIDYSFQDNSIFAAVPKIPRSPRAVKVAPPKSKIREIKVESKAPPKTAPKVEPRVPTKLVPKIRQRPENDIPVEIHVGPVPIRMQPLDKQRPLAMVKPNNSMEIDPNQLKPIPARLDHQKPQGLLQVLQQSIEAKKVLRTRHNLLSATIGNGSIVNALRKSYADRGVMYDILSTSLLNPESWTLEFAVEAAQVANLLAQSSEVHHQKLSSTVLKHILTQFRQTLENNMKAPLGIGVDLSAEQRQRRCKDLLRLVDETRESFQPTQQNATTLKEIDFLLQGFQL